MSFRRRRSRGEKPKAMIDMTSLIDLTFLLLVTFIVTLPVLEQGVTVALPQAKAEPLPRKDNKARVVSVQRDGDSYQVYLDKTRYTVDQLGQELARLVKDDPEVPVHVRADEGLRYGLVMDVIRVVKDAKVTRMALATEAR